MNIALIVFAGKGERISSSVPKQFIKVKGKDLVGYTIETFNNHPLIDEIILVTSTDFLAYTKNLVFNSRFLKVSNVVEGGKTRQESVKNGLNFVNFKENDNILIHDGDRPLVSDSIITRCIKGLDNYDALMVAIRSSQALKEVENLGMKYFDNDIAYDVQTPQCFKFGLIKNTHNQLSDKSFNDDASMVMELGHEVKIIEGDKYNFKVTTNKDLDFFIKIVSELKSKD